MKWLGTDFERSVRQSMLDYIPRLYDNSKVVDEIIRVDAEEMEAVYNATKEVLDQFFVNTATWGLSIWEKELSIIPDEGSSYQVRRAAILSKLNPISTFGIEGAINLANVFSISGHGASFSEMPKDYEFKLTYEIDDLTSVKDLYKAFDEVKPAHLHMRVGLIIVLSFFTEDSLIQRMKQLLSTSMYPDKKDTVFERINIISGTLFGTPFEVTDISLLFLNGSFLLDGSELLDGNNEDGTDIYINSEKMTITIKKDGIIIDQEVV